MTERDEYICDRLLSSQDEADWRAARGHEPDPRPTHAQMVAWFASERAAVEEHAELERVAEKAVIAQWRRDRDHRGDAA